MNSVILPRDVAGLARSDATPRALQPAGSPPAEAIVLGMPHLCATGLSEGWLLRELGHRHWFMLAEAAGMAAPDFRDVDGAPVYAAFCALSVDAADFGAARENDVLAVASSLARLSRTQVASRHRLQLRGRAIGAVEMISTFVRRTDGGNHAVARVAVDGLPPALPGAAGGGLADLAAGFRAERIKRHMGFDLADDAPLASRVFDPCPSQDFNGAGFLYFTSFLGFVDRAEWAFARDVAGAARTVRRDVFYRGNLDPGETLRVVLLGRRDAAGELSHRCRVERCGDGAVLAEVFSTRSLAG